MEPTWPAVGMAAVANIATWLMIIRGRNSVGGKRLTENQKPGTAGICRERGEKIAIIETKQTNLEKDIEEIKDDIRAIRLAVVK